MLLLHHVRMELSSKRVDLGVAPAFTARHVSADRLLGTHVRRRGGRETVIELPQHSPKEAQGRDLNPQPTDPKDGLLLPCSHSRHSPKRSRGIAPLHQRWQRCALLLSYDRISEPSLTPAPTWDVGSATESSDNRLSGGSRHKHVEPGS